MMPNNPGLANAKALSIVNFRLLIYAIRVALKSDFYSALDLNYIFIILLDLNDSNNIYFQ